MKKFRGKRVLAVAAAAMLATSMVGSMTAMAATVNIVDTNGILGANAKFNAYQVFAGRDNDGKLTDIVWGTGFTDLGTEAKLLTLVKATGASVTAADVAAFLTSGNDSDNLKNAQTFAEIAREYITNHTGITGREISSGDTVENGYYLVENSTIGTSGIRNLALLEATNDGVFEITVKVDKPTVEKKVWEEKLDGAAGTPTQTTNTEFGNDADGLKNAQWNDVADYDIGDQVPFKLTATIPADTTIPYTKGYSISFEDTFDDGLAFTDGSLKVYYQVGGGNAVELAAGGYDLSAITENTGDKTKSFSIKIDNVKTLAGFDEAAELKVYATFTAEMTSAVNAGVAEENSVSLKFSNDYTGAGEGETVRDYVAALTFDMDVNKYTGNVESNLADASFKLYKLHAGATLPSLTTERDATAGTYDLTAAAKTVLEPVYLSGSSESYVVSDIANGALIFKSTEAGDINIKGLDRDTYILVETAAPSGYNQMGDALKLEVVNTTDYIRDSYEKDDHKTTAVEYTVETRADHKVDVENRTGSLLPETGGIGTTIFYIAGTLLMAGAVFFVTAKGRKKEDNE